jgi:diguanylate cyclase
MDFTEYKIGYYKRWQKKILHTCWIMVFVLLAIEILVAVFFRISGFMKVSVLEYCIRRVILPSGINLAAVSAASFLVNSPNLTLNQKNYVSMYAFFTITAVVSLCHNYFTLVFLVPCSSFFLCALLKDKKLLFTVFIASVIVAVSSLCEWVVMEHITAIEMIGGTSFAVIVTHICFYRFAVAILGAEEEQTKFMYDSYMMQKKLLNELRLEPLTRLYNRTAFADCLSNCIKVYNEKGGSLMLALIDLDNFKSVNDNFGHASGDAVLIAFSELVVKVLGGNRNAFRYGGDEFVLLFKNQSLEAVEGTAEQIRSRFAETEFDFMGKDTHFSVSIGIAAYHSGMTSKEWFEAVDSAAYAAKAAGKNQIVTVP